MRGDVVEIFPAYEREKAIRIEWFGDEIETISEVDPLRGKVLRKIDEVSIFPGSHYVTPADRAGARDDRHQGRAARAARASCKASNKLVEEQRLQQRTLYDLEMLEQMGRCKGIENYSRHLSGRAPGEPPPTLLDYFPKDYLLFVDESHQTVPQIARDVQRRPLAQGDAGRVRLPPALGARQPAAAASTSGEARVGPGGLRVGHARRIRAAARPRAWWSSRSSARPACSTRRSRCARSARQVDDLLGEIRERVKVGDRVLVTTLTKRMAEDLTEYYAELGVRVRYLHSDIDTLERIEILRDLRLGEFDVLVGINLLREGLDLPEVSLVAILDADKEGFLRAERSLIQTIGRAARNVRGKVIMYADRETDSMKKAIGVTRQPPRHAGGLQPRARHHAQDHREGDPGRWRARAQDDFVDVDASRPKKAQEDRHPARGAAPDHLGDAQRDVRPGRGAGVREGRRPPRPDQGPRRDPPLDGQR